MENGLNLMLHTENSKKNKNSKKKSTKEQSNNEEKEEEKEEEIIKESEKDKEIEMMRLEIQDLRDELEEAKVLNSMDLEDMTQELEQTKEKLRKLEETNRVLEHENQTIFDKYMKLEDDYNQLLDSYEVDTPKINKPRLCNSLTTPVRRDSRQKYLDINNGIDRPNSLNNPLDSSSGRLNKEIVHRTQSLPFNNKNHSLNKQSNSLNVKTNSSNRSKKKPSSIVMLCDILTDSIDEEMLSS